MRAALLACVFGAASAGPGPVLGSKRASSQFWVKRPGSATHIELVSSLSAVCTRHELDEGEEL